MKNTKTRTQQLTLALFLLTISLLSLQPALTLADHGSQKGTITINASGQATPMDPKVTGGLATLSLSGNAGQDGNSVKLSGLSGNLQVGANNYPISNGQGQANPRGTIEIHATTNGNGNNKKELNLYGHMQGSNITFDPHQSKLSSMFFLSLSGQANMNITQTISKSISNTISKTINNTISKTSHSSEENQTDNESEHSATVTNQTESDSEHAATVTQTITVTQALTSLQNNTVTQTVTNTLNGNQTITITVTNTVGNVTTTKTVTSTVTNSTITVTATVTVANTTVTVT